MSPFGFLLARRQFLGLGVASAIASPAAFALPRKPLEFPRDHGAHPDFRSEWWYLTGYANTALQQAAFGYQVTFFRSRVPQTQNMQSDLAARQLIFAHAAVTDVANNKLWHGQRIARSSGAEPGQNPTDLASGSTKTTELVLKDWTLRRSGGKLSAHIVGELFSLDLIFTASQPLLLQGEQGLSRKGPDPEQASYYYSQPQLQASGLLRVRDRQTTVEVGSTAWLDHEWSQEMLHPQAVGWDWIGMNLEDGSALMAFRLRTQSGKTLWDGGSFRNADKRLNFVRGAVDFQPLRSWKSPETQATYPVEWMVQTPVGSFIVRALVDNQELDSRASTGAIYWEGLCELQDNQRRRVGRGYLEMTGYVAPIRM